LTPRQLILEVCTQIDADGLSGDCQALVDWCIYAGIKYDAADDNSPVHIDQDVVPPVADATFLNWSSTYLNIRLPELAGAMGAAVAATTRIANIMNDVLQEQRDARMDAQAFRASTKAPKSVGEFFKAHMTNKLMVLCHVASEADLPDFWASIAEANGKREREAIEVVVREMANGLGWDELSPVITPQLAKKLSTLRLAGSNLDDLDEGVNPFSIVIMDHTSAGEKAYHDALTAANDYDDLMKGSSAVDLNDLKSLKQVKILIPETFSTARAMLQSFRILLMCMIGDAHAISRNYTRFLGNYIGKENFYNGRIQRVDPKLGPARLLRYVQLHMRAWFHNIGMANDLVTAGDVTPPKLMEALERPPSGI
jgi:hypothetical protein